MKSFEKGDDGKGEREKTQGCSSEMQTKYTERPPQPYTALLFFILNTVLLFFPPLCPAVHFAHTYSPTHPFGQLAG